LEEAFQARAGGNVDIVPLHRDMAGLKEEEKGDVGQREINEAIEAFKEKNGREPNEEELGDYLTAKETQKGTPTEAEMIRVEDILR
jgi:hypothetical protein